MEIKKREVWLALGILTILVYWRALGLMLLSDDWFWFDFQGDFNWGLVGGWDCHLNSWEMQSNFFRPAGWIITGILTELQCPLWFHHLHNLVLLAVCAGLFYGLLRRWYGTGYSFLGAVMFLIMPWNSEPAAWLSSIFTFYMVIFGLLATRAMMEGDYGKSLVLTILTVHSQEAGYGIFLALLAVFPRKWQWTMLTAFLCGVLRWVVIGGAGVYGLEWYLSMLNPINWGVWVGYYLRFLF